VGVAIVPTIIALGTIYATYKIAPFQEVESEKAKQSEETRQLSKQAPLQARIEESWNNETDVVWLFDRPLSSSDIEAFNRLPIAPVENVKNFAESRHGVRVGAYCVGASCDGSQTRFKLRLTGHRARPVQITQMSARIIQQGSAPRGAYISGPTGGLEDVQAGRILLDSGDLRLRAIREDGSTGRPVLDEKYVYVDRGEPVVFEIFAVSRSKDYRWEVLLEILVDGKSQQMVVRRDGTPSGSPFRTPGRIYPPSMYSVYGQCEMIAPNATCKARRNG
jgi:hypothetical protein